MSNLSHAASSIYCGSSGLHHSMRRVKRGCQISNWLNETHYYHQRSSTSPHCALHCGIINDSALQNDRASHGTLINFFIGGGPIFVAGGGSLWTCPAVSPSKSFGT